MDKEDGEEQSPLPIDFNGSLDPSQLPNVTLGNDSLMASHSEPYAPMNMASNINGAGRRSPVKTIKEYNQQVSDLTKENFNLKLRIYHLEERMEKQYGDEQDVFKTNIELKVMVDNLEEELSEKQTYLLKAAQAVSTMTVNHQQAEEAIRQQCMSDHKEELNRLKEALDKAVQECDKSKKQAEEATMELDKMEDDLRLAHKTNEELSEKLKATHVHIDSLETKLKESDGLVHELKDNMSCLQKQLERKDRDMKRLSVCFEDKSLIETSILEPQHLQDRYEDQLEEVEKLKKRILDLESELGLKDDKLEETQKELDGKLKEIDDKTLNLAKCQKTIGFMMNKLREINKNNELKEKKFKSLESEVRALRLSLDNATKEKTQGFMQSLGKKEGEISGFQEQLKKAMEALTNSETAVEELQMQLKKERAEFENKLRNQANLFDDCKNQDSSDEVAALQQQVATLKKMMADQNVVILGLKRELTDLERQNKKLKDKEKGLLDERESHEKKMSILDREIHSLRLELERKDMRIGNLQQNTVHIETPGHAGNPLNVNVQLLPMNVMEDMRLMVDNLHQELLTVKVLQNSLQNLVSRGGASDTLKPEFEAVKKIYQQLEEGVIKNSQLHKCLFNSVQETVFNEAKTASHFNHGHYASGSPQPMRSNIHGDQVDGLALTSPIQLNDETLTGKDDGLDNPEIVDNKLHLSDLEHTKHNASGKLSHDGHFTTASTHPADQSLTEVSSLDHSLTDDAKEGNLRHTNSMDYNAFQLYFEPRMQDRASLYRLDSQEDNGLQQHFISPKVPGQRFSQGQGKNISQTTPPVDLIDLSSHSQGQDNSSGMENVSEKLAGNNSFSSVTRRESRNMNNSYPNVIRRSDTFTDRFSNVSVRNSGVDINPNMTVKSSEDPSEILDTNRVSPRVSGEFEKNGSQLSDTLEAGSTQDPDVVKSTIGSRMREDGLEETVHDEPDQKGRSWAEKLAQYEGTVDGHTQTTPSKDCENQNNSGVVSRLLSPDKDRQYLSDRSTSAIEWHNLVTQLQAHLLDAVRQKEEAFFEVQKLQDKLEATENTVRQLSRKMKSYHSNLEQAGLNPLLKRRSSSEASLGQVGQPQRQSPLRRGSDDKGDSEESCSAMSMDRASMEKGREDYARAMSLKSVSITSPSLIMMSPTSSSCMKRSSPTSTIRSDRTCMSSPERMSQMNGPHSGVFGNQNPSTSPLRDFIIDHTEHNHQNTSLNNTRHHQHQQSDDRTFYNASVLNVTGVDWNDRKEENDQEDPTLTSLLVTDYSSLHKRLSILSKSFMNSPGDQSFNNTTLSVEKLQARLAHLERIIVMQKEEITVYESLLTSMGVPVLTSSDQGSETNTTEDSKESLLRQHLVEIRKLRRRLENLDLSNDPDQLLIFHTHTQQRITQQEHTISKLQQKLIEKEEIWNRETMETEHRMNREKVMLSQKLDIAKEEVQNQCMALEEQEKLIQNLRVSLHLKEEGNKVMEEENEKLKQDRMEIEEDLVKREKEFLDMEKTMFKLEISKEEVESQKTMIKAELEENEKQVKKLKCDIDHYKESCRSLKEALKHKDECLQEQVQCLTKMGHEKTEVDEKLSQLQLELEELKANGKKMRLEAEEKKKLELDYDDLRCEFTQLKLILEQKTSLHTQMLGQKSELEGEISRLYDEKFQVEVEVEKRIDDLRTKMENEFKIKHQEMGEEVSNLRSMLDKRRNLESELRTRVTSLEANLRKEEGERATVEDELKEKAEKVKKRDKQCQFVLDRFGKLEAAYKKQSQILKDKNEAINSMKKQLQLYESTLSNLSKGNEQGTLKELFHELMLTKTQVANLLTRLEGSSNQMLSLPEFNLDAFSTSTSSSTTTITSETTETSTLQSTCVSNNATTNTTKELISMKSYGGSGSMDDLTAEPGISKPNSSFMNLDPHSLCAILKLEQHEKSSKQAGECLVLLSGVEARIEDRMKAYKAKTVTESLDYSTLREAGIACHQIRTCLNEVSRIISLAWITELPLVTEEGRFYDPETENLKSELSELQFKYDLLDTTVKEQKGKLSVSKQRQKDWEHSVCRQLLRTSQDLEQAKENLDLSRGILQQVNTSTNTNNKSTEGTKAGDIPKQKSHLSLQSEMN